ncbi:PRC-barrel domain-containing protein [Paracoccus litorisediminis]|uniref:PRC-barrel domain containing protein n=1 Tax=Paracoccus litorisediminis TaxID=2006130 RepID=A0A844HS05_9RHOB|nr:PRC-barrel domain-containing protein [Paracoccus litorisediminis]MTH61858.1 PRC-barrel domain containing protein [Paracoccus litorisediminis]
MNDTVGTLVSSANVNGTAVYGRDGSHIGTIDHLMIDKPSGNVAYAVMGFGGFLGLGEEHLPVPWHALRYDTALGGFVTDLTEEQVTGAPARSEGWDRDRDWETRTYEYYGCPPYWI